MPLTGQMGGGSSRGSTSAGSLVATFSFGERLVGAGRGVIDCQLDNFVECGGLFETVVVWGATAMQCVVMMDNVSCFSALGGDWKECSCQDV